MPPTKKTDFPFKLILMLIEGLFTQEYTLQNTDFSCKPFFKMMNKNSKSLLFSTKKNCSDQ